MSTEQEKKKFEGYVDIGGRKLFAKVFGQGPTVVLEPGAGGGGGWGEVPKQIARFATVVMYDRANVGRSDKIKNRGSVLDISDDLHHLLQALHREINLPLPAVLLGWSYSGLSVQCHAVRFPEEVSGLVLVDPTPDDFADWSKDMGRMNPVFVLGLLFRLGYGKYWGRKHFENFLRSNSGKIASDEVLQEYMDSLAGIKNLALGELGHIEKSSILTRELLDSRSLPRIPVILLRALVTGNASENVMKRSDANRKAVAEKWPNGELVDVEGGSHQMTLDRPDAMIDAVRDVLARAQAS